MEIQPDWHLENGQPYVSSSHSPHEGQACPAGAQALHESLAAWQHTLVVQAPKGDILDVLESNKRRSNAMDHFDDLVKCADEDEPQVPLTGTTVMIQCLTTLMVRNLPRSLKPKQLHEKLEQAGLGNCYDFLYMPAFLKSCTNLGYAFINFENPGQAALLVDQWQGGFVFAGQNKQLELNPAAKQGSEDIINLCIQKRLIKFRNSRFRPFIRDSTLIPVSL
mmetsp:Transcript_2561/g.6513  ORF Transcript_2561/g.6513 Transcript_2561/m.6513 type:complete len:221 (-) Transcript_2561:262-924(-)